MSEKAIGIITLANDEIGVGHLSRSIAIAQELLELKVDTTLILNLSSHLRNFEIPQNLKLLEVEKNDWNQSFFEFLISSFSFLFFDLLLEDLNLFSVLNSKIKSASIMSYPFHEKECWTDIIFYPSIKEVDGHKTYSGPRYISFRNGFKKLNHTYNKFGNILVTMGGSDSFQLTLPVVEALVTIKSDFKYCVIIAESCKDYKSILEKAKQNKNITIINYSKNIQKLLRESSLVIINGGITRYEATLMGAPFVAISIHQTQFNITKHLSDITGSLNLGIKANLNRDLIADGILRLMNDERKRIEISKISRKLLDNKGSKRIAQIIHANLLN